jgi:hypothetical protein
MSSKKNDIEDILRQFLPKGGEKNHTSPPPLLDLRLKQPTKPPVVDLTGEDIQPLSIDPKARDLKEVQDFIQTHIEMVLMDENMEKIKPDMRHFYLPRKLQTDDRFKVLKQMYNPRNRYLTMTIQDTERTIRYKIQIIVYPDGGAEPILFPIEQVEDTPSRQ